MTIMKYTRFYLKFYGVRIIIMEFWVLFSFKSLAINFVLLKKVNEKEYRKNKKYRKQPLAVEEDDCREHEKEEKLIFLLINFFLIYIFLCF